MKYSQTYSTAFLRFSRCLSLHGILARAISISLSQATAGSALKRRVVHRAPLISRVTSRSGAKTLVTHRRRAFLLRDSAKNRTFYIVVMRRVARKSDARNRKRTTRSSVSLFLFPLATIPGPSKHIHNARRNAQPCQKSSGKSQIRPYTRECGDTYAITVSLILLLLGVAPTNIAAIYTATFAFSTCPT